MSRPQLKVYGISLAAAVVTILFIVPHLFMSPVSSVCEAREGSVVQEILRSGEFVLPLRNGQVIPSKPPLFHWLAAGISQVFEHFDEFTLRLPSALAAAGTVAATAWAAATSGGVCAGGTAALAVLLSFGFLNLAAAGRVDMLFCLLTVLPVLIWLVAAGQLKSRGSSLAELPDAVYHVMGVLCGLAMLTKGPLGVMLPLLVVGSVSYFLGGGYSGLQSILRIGWFWPLAISLPWYVLAAFEGGTKFLARQIVFENLRRFTGGAGIPAKPFYHYAVVFWDQFAPWSVFLPLCAGLLLLSHLCPARRKKLARFLPQAPGEKFVFNGALIWIVSVIVFLSMASGKRAVYLLPVLPALGLICAAVLPRLAQHAAGGGKGEHILFSCFLRASGYASAAALALIFAAVVLCGAYFPDLSDNYRLNVFLRSFAALVVSNFGCFSFCFFLFAAGFTVSWRKAFSKRSYFALLCGFVCFLAGLYQLLLLPGVGAKNFTHSYQKFAEEVYAVLGGAETLHVLRDAEDETLDGFFFYYPGPLRFQEPEAGLAQPGYYLVRRAWVEALPEPPWSAAVQIITAGGRMTDLPERYFALIRYWPMP